jgi:putative transposase
VIPGVAVHIIQRGNDRQVCFREDSDYLVYLHHLGQLCACMRCALHAYCLMTNHVHLLMTPVDSLACGKLMRSLGRIYVRYFNDRYGRTGTLWEGRYKSCLVDSSAYVLACYRYIELNPVRAGMVPAPAEYRWSSYSGNAGLRPDALLFPHAEYNALTLNAGRRYQSYRDMVGQGDAPAFLDGIRSATHGGYGLVGEDLKNRVLSDLGRKLERGKPGPRPEQKPETSDDHQELLL